MYLIGRRRIRSDWNRPSVGGPCTGQSYCIRLTGTSYRVYSPRRAAVGRRSVRHSVGPVIVFTRSVGRGGRKERISRHPAVPAGQQDGGTAGWRDSRLVEQQAGRPVVLFNPRRSTAGWLYRSTREDAPRSATGWLFSIDLRRSSVADHRQ